jgi:CRP/FNR family transcriptional regulator, cyclic AMP receptor protein
METEVNPLFDLKTFLATRDTGRTIFKYQIDQIIFSQGDVADPVFYISDGRVKITVLSEQGKEAVAAILGPNQFCGEGCLAGQRRRMDEFAKFYRGELGRYKDLLTRANIPQE